MPDWRALADTVDRITVLTFDHGGITFQKMNGLAPVGLPVGVPVEFDGAFKEIDIHDGVQATTMQPMAWIHFANFTALGLVAEEDDQLIVPGGPFADTYVIASVDTNSDGTGGQLRLRRKIKP